MQASLAAFIASHVRQCIDPAELSTRLGANVTLGQPNVTIEFTHSEALVTLDLPLNFATEGSALRMSSFSRHYQVRPVQLSWFAFNLLKRASKDPYFHINDSADYSSVPGYDGFVVTQQSLSSASVAGRQDIILISIADPLSKVDKATWFFQFLVQARPPVLDQIQNAAAKDNVQFAALAPDGDALKMIIEYYPLGEEVSRPAIIVPLSLDMDKRTWRGNLSGLIAGTYNASVNSTSSGLADWQVFTVSSS